MQPVQADEGEDEEMAFCFFTPLPGEPATVEEALSGPQKEWKAAMDAEFNSLIENGTWELVELPEGRRRSAGSGSSREIFAPVVKPVTLRTVLAGATVKGWHVKQMDITTAFLNGILLEDIYMAQPDGYEDGTSRKLEEVLLGGGFKTSQADHSLFLLGEGEQLLLLLVYVDDILLFSPSMEQIERTQKLLMDNFKGKMLGDVHYYLGLHIERDVERRWLKVHQSHYISGVMERYGVTGGRTVMTPFPAGFKLKKAAEEDDVLEDEQRNEYQSLIESVMYAAVHTQPDASFGVGQLARVVQRPIEEQLEVAKRLVRYLRSMASAGVQFSAGSQLKQIGADGVTPGTLKLSCFTDATWASEDEDQSSVGGFVCMVGGGPVSWRSKKQSEIAQSSGEAEYMAMYHAIKEIVLLRKLLEDMGADLKGPTPLFSDSEAAIGMANNPILNGLKKHMKIKWHWRVPLPSPPASSLPALADPESDSLRAASPTVTRVLATVVTDPSFESTTASALVTELVDFAAHCRLDFTASLVAESASVCPLSVGGECALSMDVLEDRQEEFQCFAAALPHLVSTLLAPEGDPDARDILTPRSYAEAIEGPYSSQWQAAMDAEMASWKSIGTYVDEVPPPGANIVSGMWIFRVKRPPGSPHVFKVRYVARGFSQRQGVD
ncbi:unnamed protein product [Closterium sp. NIES-53]